VKLKIFIISQEEPFYIPKVIRYILEHQNKNFQIIGSTRLRPNRKDKKLFDWLIERTQLYTCWELLIVSFLMFYCKIWYTLISKFGVYNPYSVKYLYEKHNIKEFHTKNINDTKYLKQIQALDVDIILSISSPQLFGNNLLKLPKLICLNAHGTLLPKHRGVFGSWWMLFEGDKTIGATIHTMVEKIDAGDIVWQKELPKPNKATQYYIAYHTKRLIAKGVVEIINEISNNKMETYLSHNKGSYHRAPTKKQGKLFHQKGLKIITISNAKYVLVKSFKN